MPQLRCFSCMPHFSLSPLIPLPLPLSLHLKHTPTVRTMASAILSVLAGLFEVWSVGVQKVDVDARGGRADQSQSPGSDLDFGKPPHLRVRVYYVQALLIVKTSPPRLPNYRPKKEDLDR
ncbi:hypothetical protein BDZ45DRAFT_432549 [Acephala macrosclerotiorum]|nr:hypothetical protein BDZ45DRAFT_432549 [Acephala macrosclerotiorum]